MQRNVHRMCTAQWVLGNFHYVIREPVVFTTHVLFNVVKIKIVLSHENLICELLIWSMIFDFICKLKLILSQSSMPRRTLAHAWYFDFDCRIGVITNCITLLIIQAHSRIVLKEKLFISKSLPREVTNPFSSLLNMSIQLQFRFH